MLPASRILGFIYYVKDGFLRHLPLFDIIKAGQYMTENRAYCEAVRDITQRK